MGQIVFCTMMSYMGMSIAKKGAMLQAPPIGFIHVDSYHKVQPTIVTVAIINFDC